MSAGFYKYIIALIAAGIFFLAVIVYLCSAIKARRLENLRAMKQYELYSDPNLVKMDYDMAYFDEAAQAKINSRMDGEMQVSIDDLLKSKEVADNNFTPFARIEDEEIEEITGNYKP